MVARILQFSPSEEKRCFEALAKKAELADPLAAVAESADVSGYISSLTSWWAGSETSNS